MKRFGLSFASIVVIIGLLTVPALAADSTADHTIYYDDGSYAIVTFGNFSARSNADKVKTYTYYNSQGQRCFTYAIYATFTYNGITSRADSCKYQVTIHRQGWNLSTHSEYVSGNTAYGRATFTGPDGQSRTASLTLTCDKNGNVT